MKTPLPFRVHIGYTPKGRNRFSRFADLDSAKRFCESVFQRSGRVLSIESAPRVSVEDEDYAARVAVYEAQGMTTSDAQGCVDAEDLFPAR